MQTACNPLPGIGVYFPNMNPTLTSPNSEYDLPLYQTKESLQDLEVYRSFLKSVEKMFRGSVRYTHYKAFLLEFGLNKSQIHGYITSDMAPLEMHHAILNLYEISLMLTEHLLNTVGYVTTFDVVRLLKQEHSENNIAMVMMDETSHQVYHNEPAFYLHPDMCFGHWKTLLKKYKDGLTQDLAFKILYYVNKSLKVGTTDDAGLLDLRDEIKDWSAYNGNVQFS